jgi:CheY-like chemotaxis protein/serine phosphatase RsbU (regulator of sigma subunit)
MKFYKGILLVIIYVLFASLLNGQERGYSLDQTINNIESQVLQFEKEKNMLELARCQAKLGYLYKEKNDISSSIRNFQKAIKSNEDLGNVSAIKNICENIGMIYAETADFDQALVYFKKSLRMSEKQGKTTDIISELINISQILQNQKNYSESNQNLEKAVSMSQEISDFTSLKNCYLLFSENYELLGMSDKSKEYFDLAASLKSHLQKEEIKKFESRTKMAEAESFAKDVEIKSKDQKIESITKEQQLTLDLLKKEKELSELRKKESLAKERNTQIIILSLSAILILVSLSLFFIFKQLREKKRANRMLERSNQQIIEEKKKTEEQRDIANNQKKKITDSIYYAKRIQSAVLPPLSSFEKIIPDHFIFYRPRDIVSGDFYWITEKEGIVILAAVDCTGHGVPGAFMSMLGVAYLNDIVNKTTFNRHIRSLHANEILNQLRENVINSLHQTGKTNETKDGMDIALCIIDFEHKSLQFSGAHNPVYLIRSGKLMQLEADKMPIGIYKTDDVPFSNHEITLEKDDLLYIFSDGYYDQFGGPRNMKMFSSNFRKLLLEVHQKPMSVQKQLIEEYYDNWKGNNEQVDDVLVIGFKFEPQIIFSSVHQDYLWHDKKILIAEDVDFNYLLLVEALKPTKVQIARVVNGMEAVQFCKTNETDLVLMDIRMPVMDGIEATKKIRVFNKLIPIIAQTANGESKDLEDIQNAGCNDYIAKPINLKSFLSVIRKHLIK